MGVEPFLLSSSLVAVMAQRLVRRCAPIAESCRMPRPQREMLGVEGDEQVQIYHAKGCAKCNMTGYRGRTGIYELIEVDEELRTAIHEGEGEQAMLAVARKQYPGIQADGVAEYWPVRQRRRGSTVTSVT